MKEKDGYEYSPYFLTYYRKDGIHSFENFDSEADMRYWYDQNKDHITLINAFFTPIEKYQEVHLA